MLLVRRRAMAFACVVLLACDGQNPTETAHPAQPAPETRVAPDTALQSDSSGGVAAADVPGTVGDLSVTSATDTSVTVTFTEVANGLGEPASYDIRYAANSISWGSATSVSRGSCASPLAGSSVGSKRSCTVTGLVAFTKYALQLVAFRGTLNLNAVFGGLSNVAAGATNAPLPPVASVAVAPANATDTIGKSLQLTATVLDAAGNVLTGAVVAWSSSDTNVVRVDAGSVRGTAPGSATVTASSGGKSGSATIQVVPTAPGVVSDLAVSGVTDTSITLAFTEVSGGDGLGASYDVRYATRPITWWLAPSVTRGTCATPVSRTAIGARRTCTILGLNAATAYEMQMVAFRGTLNQNAVFGPLSNVAGSTTAQAPVASVTVAPALTSAVVGTATQYSAVLKDAAGRTLTGRTVTWSSSNSAVASVAGNGLASALAAGSASITASAEGKSGSGSLTVTAPSQWVNEPSGFTAMTDNPFDALDVLGWRTAWNYDGWVTPAWDPTRGNVIRFNYPIGFTGGRGPGMAYYDHAAAKDVYAGFWWMASDPWQNHPSQVNKIAFWYTGTDGQNIHLRMYGVPPYRLEAVAEFPAGTVRFQPNVSASPVTLGVWHKIEWHVKYASTAGGTDGVVEWWMDGVLQGRYTNLQSPADAGFIEYQFSPTWGGLDGVKTENDYFQYDDVHLGRR
ncbi:MAG: Ig-like domain-containing protein [Gemmatimonadetes bacterium]|nr:Ig-like domain-containing protein [Gemmatimonadota bacterium]